MHSPTPVMPSSVVISTSVAVNVSYAPAPKWMVLSALAESAQVASLEIFRLAYPLRGRQASRVGPPCPRNGGGRPAGAGLVRAPRAHRVRGRLLGHRRRPPPYRGAPHDP